MVDLKSVRSGEINIFCCLLQGDNLSQSCFHLQLIDNIIYEIKFCNAHLYANNLLALYLEIDSFNFNNSIGRINENITGINEYIELHGMQLNPGKTKTINNWQ